MTTPTSPHGRFRLAAAVNAVLLDNGRVLLMRRRGSGYHDRELGLPGGHLDGGEDALSALSRELSEELAITVDRQSCRLVTVAHRAAGAVDGAEYLDLFFTVGRWVGEPTIEEPDKCSELVWSDPGHLPVDVIDYVRHALQSIAADEPLVLAGWNGEPGSERGAATSGGSDIGCGS